MHSPSIFKNAYSSRWSHSWLTLLLCFCCLTACQRDEVYLHYETTDAEGWERNEKLHFKIDSLGTTRHYQPSILLRNTAANAYPFQSLALEVRQRWVLPQKTHDTTNKTEGMRHFLVQRKPPKAQRPKPLPDSLICARVDTVLCRLMTPQGKLKAGGVALHLYAFSLEGLDLPQGAVGHIVVRHVMRKDIIPGIANVGFSLK